MNSFFSSSLRFLILFISIQGLSQGRVLCHVATDSVNYENKIILANSAADTGQITLSGYDDSGDLVAMLENESVEGQTTVFLDLAQAFSTVPSYLLIDGDPDVLVSLGYASTAAGGTIAYTHETNESSRGWRVYAGNWDVVFDGLALLNLSDENASVSIVQRDSTGSELDATALEISSRQKKKVVLGAEFNQIHDVSYDIVSTEPIYVTSLSGSLPGVSPSYLWVNLALAMTFVTDTSDKAYSIVDTGQHVCYDANSRIDCPVEGDPFFGQDAQYSGNQSRYVDNGDGTVTDMHTALMWQRDPGDKMTFDDAVANADAFDLAGYTDWRLPSIKELYSLILFSGVDPSGYQGSGTSGLIPFIDDETFAFEYGDESAGERIIDSQFASRTTYVSTTMNGNFTDFGVNFADGRIKGYPTGPMPGQSTGKLFFVLYVRGNSNYGKNQFTDNGDGTITDATTGLMWMQMDSGDLNAGAGGEGAMNWEQALEWAENLEYAGHDDWRLPNVKELQSLVDYSRSPDSSNSAAIDPLFHVTSIVNEGGQTDYPYYWSSTTHANWTPDRSGGSAAYVAFGRALGWMQPPSGGGYTLMDVHGAGAQRSDPKTGDPAEYPYGHGPQGDVIRIYNYVRCVRDN